MRHRHIGRSRQHAWCGYLEGICRTVPVGYGITRRWLWGVVHPGDCECHDRSSSLSDGDDVHMLRGAVGHSEVAVRIGCQKQVENERVGD